MSYSPLLILPGSGLSAWFTNVIVHNPNHQLQSGNLDALCAYLGLELKAKRSTKASASKKKK